jgi:hypothetical protein
MAISTGEIVILVFLILIIGIATWWFVVAFNYGNSLKVFVYSRGANLDPGVGKTSGSVTLKCDDQSEICVQNATAICTGTNGQLNYETNKVGQIYATGTEGNTLPYGAFNTKGGGAVDLTKTLSTLANGKESYQYSFDGSTLFDGKCIAGAIGSTVRPQLIATYSCIPKGERCPAR